MSTQSSTENNSSNEQVTQVVTENEYNYDDNDDFALCIEIMRGTVVHETDNNLTKNILTTLFRKPIYDVLPDEFRQYENIPFSNMVKLITVKLFNQLVALYNNFVYQRDVDLQVNFIIDILTIINWLFTEETIYSVCCNTDLTKTGIGYSLKCIQNKREFYNLFKNKINYNTKFPEHIMWLSEKSKKSYSYKVLKELSISILHKFTPYAQGLTDIPNEIY